MGEGEKVLVVDSIAAIGSLLVDVTENSLAPGTLCWVGNNSPNQGSVHRYYKLNFGEALVDDGISVVNAKNFVTTGGQWQSLDTVNQQFLQKLFWSVDPVAGDDENTGWGVTEVEADSHPLKTLAELNRRLAGANFATAPLIHVMNDVPLSDATVLTNVRTKNGAGFPTLVGTRTELFSGTITGYSTKNPSGNAGFELTIASIPVSWTASDLIGAMIQKDDGTKTAFVVADLGSKAARISQPSTSDPIVGTQGDATNFVVGETVKIYSLTKMPIYPWPDVGLFYGLGWVHLQGFLVTGEFDQGSLGSTAAFVVQCILENYIFQGSVSGAIASCLLSNGADPGFGSLIIGAHNLIFAYSALLNCVVSVESSDLNLVDAINNDITIQGSLLSMGGSVLSSQFGNTDFGVFDNAGRAMACTSDGKWLHSNGHVYGSGNSSFIFTADTGSTSSLPKAGLTAATSAAHPIRLAGVAHDYADIPIADLTTGSFIND